MTVQVHLKQLKKRGGHIAACPVDLNPVPETLRQLITILVLWGVEAYNCKISSREAPVLTEEAMEQMEQIGKIGFGIPYGSQEADASQALETAIQGYEDGLFRIFIGSREPASLDSPLDLQEDDIITIIRLVMLTGGYFW